MQQVIVSLLQSKHTSAAGLLILASALGEIWFPQYEAQFHKTREFVMAYGFLFAGDAIKKATNGTSHWPKEPEATTVTPAPESPPTTK